MKRLKLFPKIFLYTMSIMLCGAGNQTRTFEREGNVMKKITVILACMLVCFLLFTGCTTQKDGTDQDTNLGNSVEIDDTDIAIDTDV